MGWESEQENLPERVDYTKWVLYAIPVLLVVMFVLLAVTHEDTHYNSRVKVKHLLVAATFGKVEEFEAALEKVLDIKRRLDEGADFAEMTAQYSDDYTNSDKGGMLGWVEHDKMVDAFDAYLWVGKVGVVSDPVETEYGYHLIVILDREISEAEQYQLDLNDRLNETNRSSE